MSRLQTSSRESEDSNAGREAARGGLQTDDEDVAESQSVPSPRDGSFWSMDLLTWHCARDTAIAPQGGTHVKSHVAETNRQEGRCDDDVLFGINVSL